MTNRKTAHLDPLLAYENTKPVQGNIIADGRFCTAAQSVFRLPSRLIGGCSQKALQKAEAFPANAESLSVIRVCHGERSAAISNRVRGTPTKCLSNSTGLPHRRRLAINTEAPCILYDGVHAKQGLTIIRRKSMKSPKERRAEDRRRRTERQRERRSQDRICGYCKEPATAGLIEWFGRGRPLLIPICRICLARLGARCRDMDAAGPWCHLDKQRPCADCSVTSPPEKPGQSFLRRLFSG